MFFGRKECLTRKWEYIQIHIINIRDGKMTDVVQCFECEDIFKGMYVTSHNMLSSEFGNISTRGRVAYAICCMENALEFYNEKDDSWIFVLRELWLFCNDNMAIWQERVAELTPFVVLDKVDFDVKDYKHLSKDQHDLLNKVYNSSNEVVLKILDLIYEIGITNLYVKINSEDLKEASLPHLQLVLDLMESNHIPLPNVSPFLKYDISENYGWGREFTREEIF